MIEYWGYIQLILCAVGLVFGVYMILFQGKEWGVLRRSTGQLVLATHLIVFSIPFGVMASAGLLL